LAAKPNQIQSDDVTQDVDVALLDTLIGYNLRRAATRQRERFRHIFAPLDIRPVQWTVLALILQNGPLGQSKLGTVLGMKRANVVKLLDELQERGLTERQASLKDRRAYEVHLTTKGSRLARKLLSLHEKLEADLARSFGKDDLQQLVELLRKFREVDPEPKLR
jgi:DNA-binding MarR family transcriptional regulator